MPFRPDSLPFKVHRLISSGVCSKQQLSSSSGVSQQAIDAILRGARPGPQTAHQLGKVLSYYLRQEHRHLRLEPGDPSEPGETFDPTSPRGIFEVPTTYDGVRAFDVINARGRLIKHASMPAGLVAEDDIAELWGYLNRKDPIISLGSLPKPSS